MWCSSPLQAIPAAALSDRTPHNRNRNKTAPFDGSIWITFCSGLRRISKTSCSISGPTSTTIAPIPQSKGERRICLRHDQSQISARFDGDLTVDPYIRHQWLRDFRRLSIAPVSGQPWEDFPFNHLVLAFLVAARLADPIVSLQPYQFAIDRPFTSEGFYLNHDAGGKSGPCARHEVHPRGRAGGPGRISYATC